MEVWKGIRPLQKGDRFLPKQLQANNSVTYVEQDSGEGGTQPTLLFSQ